MRPVESARAELPAPRVLATAAGEVYLEVTGHDDAPAVVLIHGFGGSLYSWRQVVPALADAGYRVIALDLPGFGYSGRPRDAAAYTPEGQAETVAQVLESLGASAERPVHLVGHSFGGGVSLELAEARPELVRSLVLVDSTLPTFSRAPNADWPLYRPMAYFLARTLGLRRIFVRAALEKAYHDDRRVTRELVDAYRNRLVLRGPASAYRGITSAIPRERLAVDLRKVEPPTLVVWGETDALIPLRAGRKAAERIPEAELAVLPECGHLPMEGCPDGVLAVVMEVLGQPDEPRTSGTNLRTKTSAYTAVSAPSAVPQPPGICRNHC
jgi:pimeloyl-ACP methyl ester carboxylesterase